MLQMERISTNLTIQYLTQTDLIRYFNAKEASPLIEQLLSNTDTKLAFVNRTNFEFTLDSIKTKFGNESNKNTIAKKAAYLISSFIFGHPLADGNKRTAAFLAELFLQINDIELLVSDGEFLTALIDLAAGRIHEKDIREFILQNIR